MIIYKITNLINGAVYIGQTIQKDKSRRWWDHKNDANHGHISHLSNSIRKYGEEYFRWQIVDEATTLDELNDKEDRWLETYKKIGPVYNNRKDGNNKQHSPESIEKMKKAQTKSHRDRKLRGTDKGWTRRDGGSMKDRKHSIKTREKMSISARNKPPVSIESKKKMSISARNKPPITDETRKRMSLSQQNRRNKIKEIKK